MIFGIPLTAFLIVAWRLLCRKYFQIPFVEFKNRYLVKILNLNFVNRVFA